MLKMLAVTVHVIVHFAKISGIVVFITGSISDRF